MAVSIHRDGKLTATLVEFHKHRTLNFSLAWLNCAFHVLLSAVTIFWNAKILAGGIKRRLKEMDVFYHDSV